MTPGYTRTAIMLHWLVALLILSTFPVGLYMVGLKLSPTKLRIYSYHKWIGVTVFLLVAARLAWRLYRPAPPLPATMPAWERSLAGASHVMLYLLMIAAPISGWLMSSASGFQVVYLGVLPLPDLVGKDKVLAEQLKWLHEYLDWALAAFVVLHVAAALKHWLVDRDDVLGRMVPFLNRSRENP